MNSYDDAGIFRIKPHQTKRVSKEFPTYSKTKEKTAIFFILLVIWFYFDSATTLSFSRETSIK